MAATVARVNSVDCHRNSVTVTPAGAMIKSVPLGYGALASAGLWLATAPGGTGAAALPQLFLT